MSCRAQYLVVPPGVQEIFEQFQSFVGVLRRREHRTRSARVCARNFSKNSKRDGLKSKIHRALAYCLRMSYLCACVAVLRLSVISFENPPAFSTGRMPAYFRSRRSVQIRRCRSDPGSSPWSTPPRSPLQTSPSSPRRHRLPPAPGVGSANRRSGQHGCRST
jgi:hypothetical protein